MEVVLLPAFRFGENGQRWYYSRIGNICSTMLGRISRLLPKKGRGDFRAERLAL